MRGIKRYEAGASQPSLDALRKIVLTLGVNLDALVVGDTERGPDETLKHKLEAIRQFSADRRGTHRDQSQDRNERQARADR